MFERLLDDSPHVRQPVSPSRAHDVSSLQDSVRSDLVRLLNTRSPLRGVPRTLSGDTVLAYGIPDLSPTSPDSEQDRQNLSVVIAHAITIFEPRLSNVKVVIQADKSDPRAVIGVIYANLVVGNVFEPVSFPLTLDRSRSKIDVEGGGLAV